MNIIEQLGFNRLVYVSEKSNLSDDELGIIEQVKEFGIDSIYFCTNENHSYPALFLKKVIEFDGAALKDIAEIQRKTWNYKKILFLYVYTDTEIRIYNCVKKPVVATAYTNYNEALADFEIISSSISDTKKLNLLSGLFSAIAIDTGIIWTADDVSKTREKINIKTRVDNFLVESLIRATKKLCEYGLSISLVHKLLLRSLFLLYLEDRGATDVKFYNQINQKSSSYFQLLDNVHDTYKLYKTLEKHFNGSLFAIEDDECDGVKVEHLKIIKHCFKYGDDGTSQPTLFPEWRIFDFKIIQIELLSEIYENFLAKMEPEKKYQTGTFYTPPSLVELILSEKLPVDKKNKNYNFKVLDPACGSGIFLVESFKRLIKRYENACGEKLTDYGTLKGLLLDNIFGIDINPNSLKIAAFSLYLALLENLDPKTLWQKVELPNLIDDPDMPIKKRGGNLFCLDTIDTIKDDHKLKKNQFDLVVGNPPFGKDNLSSSIIKYCNKFKFAKEQVLPFLHKAVDFAPNGDIALIFNAKVLTNNSPSYNNFRKWLFNSCYVERVYNFSILRKAPKNYGGQLFNSSSSPVCIVFYKKNVPDQHSNNIIYYAPRTFVKSNVLDGIVIDNNAVKYLRREEYQKSETKIWKIAMWGGEGDIALINKLTSENMGTIKQFLGRYAIESGVGFGLLTHEEKTEPKISDKLANMVYLDSDNITRYYTGVNSVMNVVKSLKTEKAKSFYKDLYKVKDISQIKKIRHFRRLGDIGAYRAPHIVVKKGLENNKLCASFIDFDCSFKDGVYGFYSKDSKVLKVLTAYFNSSLSTYFVFMTNSSYGIEREQIMKEEYLSIPICLNEQQINEIADLISAPLDNMKENYHFIDSELPSDIRNKIESIIYAGLGLTDRDIAIIKDAIECNIDLFHNKENSQALRSVNNTKHYAKMICEEINGFLEGQNLHTTATIYSIDNNIPVLMIKLTFNTMKGKYIVSSENINEELRKIDQYLWKQQGASIYFKKNLNYYDGDDIYIIRPNQKRFWTHSAAIDDAAEIILDGLNVGSNQ